MAQRRSLRPRPPVVTATVVISQLNCLPIAGIDPRRFLEVVRARRLPHGRAGKLVLVDAEVLREELLRNTSDEESDVAEAEVDDDEPRCVDDVLRVIGRRAT